MNIKEIRDASDDWFNNLIVPKDYKNRIILNDSDRNLTIIGMRRLGKTDFLKYKAFNSKFKSKEILFINFDDPIFTGIDFSSNSGGRISFIKDIVSLLSLGEIRLVLLDEVQRLYEWARVLKGLIDKFENLRFYATGSDAIELLKSQEQGTDRFQIRYMGPYTYVEFLSLKNNNKNDNDYIDEYSFPPNNMTMEDKFQAVVEKQVFLSQYKKLNIKVMFKNISLNPGNKITKSRIVKMVKSNSDATFDNKQVSSFIQFLIESQLVFEIPDKYSTNKSSKKTIYTLYPFDWNTYKYYKYNKTYSKLNSKIDKNEEVKSLPTKGFVFENMIISNLYSMFNRELLRTRLSNKVRTPDVDIYIDDQAYEIKSFDITQLREDELIKIINKAKKTSSIVIHTGVTKEIAEIKVINWKEFLKETYKEIFSHYSK